MTPTSPTQHITSFLNEWQATTATVAKMIAAGDTSFLRNLVHLEELSSANMISHEGYQCLDNAASALLMQKGLSSKLTRQTARRALLKAFEAHLPKARRTGRLSEQAIVAHAKAAMTSHRRDDGLYIFPVTFAFRATTTDFSVGVGRIVAKPIFEVEMADAWARYFDGDESDGSGMKLAAHWQDHAQDFDHFIIVEVEGYEEEMAWPAARDAADALLNIIRMFYRYGAMNDVRIGDGYIWQNQRSTLRLTLDRDICLSTSFGGAGSHLKSGWETRFGQELAGFAPLLSMSVSINVANDGRRNPTVERLTYFNRLIAEAYCEPHHPIRLVRMVSALEAISLIGSKDKAHNLAHRCGSIGGWGDPHSYCAIYDAVRQAYHWRNAVVHGDAPNETDVMRAFHAVEKHLLAIYLGMLWMHADIADVNPARSIAKLRQEFERRVDMFFWSPSLAA